MSAAAEREKDLGVAAGAAPFDPTQSPPAAWTAEALVTAWQSVFTGIEAHIQDRMAMRDPASPETYLSIIRADVADVNRQSARIVNSRWHDYGSQRRQIERLEVCNAALLEVAKEARDLLVDELVKEPDRTVFWKLVRAIAKAEGR